MLNDTVRMRALYILFIVLISAGIITGIYFIIKKALENKASRLILKNSKRYAQIREMNKSFAFYPLKEFYTRKWKLNTKQKFDHFNYEKAFLEWIEQCLPEFERIIYESKQNKAMHVQYELRFSKLTDFADKDAVKKYAVPYGLYKKQERKMTDSITLKPVLSPCFECQKSYTSPKGQNYYYECCRFNLEQAKLYIKKYKEIQTNKNSSKVERSKMSPKLRYEVLKRDNFRCVLCGRGQNDGVKLHADHIRPIAKGGKTVLSNLRTLCEDCNRGKSDSFDEFGQN